ncbi:hypothetical protein [Ascidiimonas sp. W6]|uniref:hypothetical protein n=1 Tax=Ascidiimonas meishanensis TaxID=3128903 RepID=UPI0030ECB3F9
MNQQTNQFKTIQVIGIGLLSGIAFFLVISLWLQDTVSMDYDAEDFMLPIAFMLFFSGAIAAFYLVNRFLVPPTSYNLSAKISNYQTKIIIKMALLEGPSFFAIFQFLNSGSLLYLLIPLFAVILMVYLFPSKHKFISEYQLSMQDKIIIDKMN